MRLIDADALYDYIQKEKAWKQGTIPNYRYDRGKRDAYYEMLDIIADVPTIDTETAIHAHWEDDGSGHDDMICSHCGEYPATDEDGWTFDMLKNWGSQYCPNCGAKMDEEV